MGERLAVLEKLFFQQEQKGIEKTLVWRQVYKSLGSSRYLFFWKKCVTTAFDSLEAIVLEL